MREERQGGSIIAKDVQTLLLEKYKVEYDLQSVHVVWDRINFSWVKRYLFRPGAGDNAGREHQRRDSVQRD